MAIEAPVKHAKAKQKFRRQMRPLVRDLCTVLTVEEQRELAAILLNTKLDNLI